MVGIVEELKGKGIFGSTAKYCITWNKKLLVCCLCCHHTQIVESNAKKEQRKIYKFAVKPNASSHLEDSEVLGFFPYNDSREVLIFNKIFQAYFVVKF